MNGPTDEAIAEAVFAYQLVSRMDFGPLGGVTHYLALAPSEDPPARLIAKLAGRGFHVKPVSTCRTSPDGVFDRATGERGIINTIGAGDWSPRLRGAAPPTELIDSAFHGMVLGEDFFHGLGGHGFRYHLTYSNGEWNVSGAEMLWIS